MSNSAAAATASNNTGGGSGAATAAPRSISDALYRDSRYLLSPWPLRAILFSFLGAVVGTVALIAVVPTLIPKVPASVRKTMWTTTLELEAARLSLVAPDLAAGLRRDVARSDGRPRLRHIGYLLVSTLATGPVGAYLAGLALLATGVLIVSPWLIAQGHGPITIGPWTLHTMTEAWLATAVGTLALPVACYLVGVYSAATAALASSTFRDTPELLREVSRLTDSRTALLNAAAQERQRIESELHDRVQHRLVALALSLGIAENLHGDDETGRLAADAHRQLDGVLAELRAVILGIQPQALPEYGFVAAVTDLVATYPLPITCDFATTEAQGRLPVPVEQVGYAVVTEALTNAIKHSGADSVAVHATRAGTHWWLRIVDDGVGGAEQSGGHGLDMLAARVAGVDGTFNVYSPSGGPTEIVVSCPLHGGA